MVEGKRSPAEEVMEERGITESELKEFIRDTPKDTIVEFRLTHMAPRRQGTPQSFFAKYLGTSPATTEDPSPVELGFRKLSEGISLGGLGASEDQFIAIKDVSGITVYGPQKKYGS